MLGLSIVSCLAVATAFVWGLRSRSPFLAVSAYMGTAVPLIAVCTCWYAFSQPYNWWWAQRYFFEAGVAVLTILAYMAFSKSRLRAVALILLCISFRESVRTGSTSPAWISTINSKSPSWLKCPQVLLLRSP